MTTEAGLQELLAAFVIRERLQVALIYLPDISTPLS